MKFHTLELVAMIAGELRGDGSKIVYAHGVYDALTVGHMRHLRAAKAMGDVLIVTVTPDAHVGKPGRPLFTDVIRCEALAALTCVDYVAINDERTAANAIRRIRPHIFVKGGEYRGNMTAELDAEAEAVLSVGGVVAYTDSDEFHTSELIDVIRG